MLLVRLSAGLMRVKKAAFDRSIFVVLLSLGAEVGAGYLCSKIGAPWWTGCLVVLVAHLFIIKLVFDTGMFKALLVWLLSTAVWVGFVVLCVRAFRYMAVGGL